MIGILVLFIFMFLSFFQVTDWYKQFRLIWNKHCFVSCSISNSFSLPLCISWILCPFTQEAQITAPVLKWLYCIRFLLKSILQDFATSRNQLYPIFKLYFWAFKASVRTVELKTERESAEWHKGNGQQAVLPTVLLYSANFRVFLSKKVTEGQSKDFFCFC